MLDHVSVVAICLKMSGSDVELPPSVASTPDVEMPPSEPEDDCQAQHRCKCRLNCAFVVDHASIRLQQEACQEDEKKETLFKLVSLQLLDKDGGVQMGYIKWYAGRSGSTAMSPVLQQWITWSS
jgi:hypothetical protein